MVFVKVPQIMQRNLLAIFVIPTVNQWLAEGDTVYVTYVVRCGCGSVCASRVVCVPSIYPQEVLWCCPLVHWWSCTAAHLLLMIMLHIAKRGNCANVQRLFPVYDFFVGNPILTFFRWRRWTGKWIIVIHNGVRSWSPRFWKTRKKKKYVRPLFLYSRQLLNDFLQIVSLYKEIFHSKICYSIGYRPDRCMDIIPRRAHPSPRSYNWFLWYDSDRLAVAVGISQHTYAAASSLYVSDKRGNIVLLVNDTLKWIVPTYTYNTLDIYTSVGRYPGPKIF